MDFSAELTTAEKIAACTSAINQLEPGVYENMVVNGLDPATTPSDWDVPAGHSADDYPSEHALKEQLDRLNAAKAVLASLS